VTRIGRILFQLPAQPGDMRVDRSPADGCTGPPYFAEQLHSRRDRSAPPHQGKEEPEFSSGHAYRLSTPQYRLSGGLEQNASEADRAREPRCGTGRKTASPSQQLFHTREQLTDDRGILVSGAIQLMRAEEVCFSACDRKRSGNLELVYDRPNLCDSIERLIGADIPRGGGRHRFEFRFILIVDDEDSRNASLVGAVSNAQAAGVRGMAVPTPAPAELLEGYDRRRVWTEEQIGSGMLLPDPEVPDRWYEVKSRCTGSDLFVTWPVFQKRASDGRGVSPRLSFQRFKTARDCLGPEIEV
jgi:hypothetical protein